MAIRTEPSRCWVLAKHSVLVIGNELCRDDHWLSARMVRGPAGFQAVRLNVFTWIIILRIAAAGAVACDLHYRGDHPSSATEEPASILRDLGSISVKDRDPRFVFTISILGPLGVMLAHLLLSTLYAGFRRADFQDDADRNGLLA